MSQCISSIDWRDEELPKQVFSLVEKGASMGSDETSIFPRLSNNHERTTLFTQTVSLLVLDFDLEYTSVFYILEHFGNHVCYIDFMRINLARGIHFRLREDDLDHLLWLFLYDFPLYNISHPGLVELVVDWGANVNAHDGNPLSRHSPLHLAALRNKTNLARKFLSFGANVNAVDSKGNTPLHLAVQHNFVEMVRLLLEQPNIRLNTRNKDGETVLIIVNSSEDYKVVADLFCKAKSDRESIKKKTTCMIS